MPAHGNVIALETQNGAIFLVERLERALFGARSDVVSQEFDGLEKQVLDTFGITNPWDEDPVLAADSPCLDMRGAALSEDKLEEAANLVVESYGTPTDVFLAPRANSDLAKAFYPRERVNLPYPTEGKVGVAINSFVSNAGLIALNPDVFLRSGRNNGVKTVPGSATSSRAPATPSALTASAAGSSKSKFIAADEGDYLYAVTAINRFGESAPKNLAGAVTVAAADKVTLTITDGGGSDAATAYKIYRSSKGGLITTAILMVPGYPRDTVTPADTVFVDYNFYLPGTSKAYMVQNNLQFHSFRQLAPMLKLPLATIAASIRWMQLLYGVPIVYSGKKSRIFLNVKDD